MHYSIEKAKSDRTPNKLSQQVQRPRQSIPRRSDQCTGPQWRPNKSLRTQQSRVCESRGYSTGQTEEWRPFCGCLHKYPQTGHRYWYLVEESVDKGWSRDVVQDIQSKCRGNWGCSESGEEGKEREADIYAQAETWSGQCAEYCDAVSKDKESFKWRHYKQSTRGA